LPGSCQLTDSRRCTTTPYNKRLRARLPAGGATPVGAQREEAAELAIEIVAKQSRRWRAPGRPKRSCRRSSPTIAIRASPAAKVQTSRHRDVAHGRVVRPRIRERKHSPELYRHVPDIGWRPRAGRVAGCPGARLSGSTSSTRWRSSGRWMSRGSRRSSTSASGGVYEVCSTRGCPTPSCVTSSTVTTISRGSASAPVCGRRLSTSAATRGRFSISSRLSPPTPSFVDLGMPGDATRWSHSPVRAHHGVASPPIPASPIHAPAGAGADGPVAAKAVAALLASRALPLATSRCPAGLDRARDFIAICRRGDSGVLASRGGDP
jgi:hypothetical protein